MIYKLLRLIIGLPILSYLLNWKGEPLIIMTVFLILMLTLSPYTIGNVYKNKDI